SDVRFTVRYSPLQLETVSTAVKVDLIDRSLAFTVEGSSTGSVFSYDVIQESTVSTLLPGGTISLPDAQIGGDRTSVTVRVRNTGTADGRVASIDVTGTGFTLSEAPFTPLILTPGSSTTLVLNFAPTAPGRVAGRLRIGADSFTVTGNGLGQTLIYSYISGSVTSTVANNGNVIFPPVAVGQSSTLRFLITNNGTAAGAVNSISVTTAGTIFALSSVPDLPTTIGPGETLNFAVTFAPTATGAVTGTLKIDSLSFNLSGVGNPPAALPEYRYTGANGAQEPLAQVAVGLTMGAAYPLTLNGTLTLTFNSEVFSNDPTVQFATGGRTVAFSIPANTTQAIFPNNTNQIRLQTGTVAGIITMTPSFVTDGGIILTPTIPPALNLTVPQSAPRLQNVQVTARTTTGFSLLITGYATGRSITQIDATITPVFGEKVTTTRLTLNVDPSFTAWYQSTASTAFGSQFTATLPITLTGNVTNVTNLIDTIQSVSVTLTNRQGVSPARSVDVR
ncbi:MAG: choice-of-anchor D domain-containing protein, partial [Bryobacteraceae bacterium]